MMKIKISRPAGRVWSLTARRWARQRRPSAPRWYPAEAEPAGPAAAAAAAAAAAGPPPPAAAVGPTAKRPVSPPAESSRQWTATCCGQRSQVRGQGSDVEVRGERSQSEVRYRGA